MPFYLCLSVTKLLDPTAPCKPLLQYQPLSHHQAQGLTLSDRAETGVWLLEKEERKERALKEAS